MNNMKFEGRYLLCSVLALTIGVFYSSFIMAEELEELQECGACHTEQTSDFEASVHYINRSGVQAGCNNCHAGLQHKAGKDTPKDVQKPRMEMALSEWKRMNENDSKECQTCHSHMAMDLAKQEPRSVERHEESFKNGETSCIDCHKGISHQLPSGWKTIAEEAGLQK
jgi:cytochrome c-type protein NapC